MFIYYLLCTKWKLEEKNPSIYFAGFIKFTPGWEHLTALTWVMCLVYSGLHYEEER